MWPLEHTEITSATPQTVWGLWADVPRWVEWDEGLQSIRLDGPFVVGTPGRISPKGSPSWPFTLTAVQPQRSFTDETRLPLCRLRFGHALTPAPDGRTAITISVSFHGLLAPLFQRVIGKDIAADLAAQTARLARAAEAEEQRLAGTAARETARGAA